MNIRKFLSSALIPIYDLELLMGNVIERVDEPAGTICPFAIIFKSRLHHAEIEKTLKLPPEVQKFENADRHYPLETGYVCSSSKHVIAGPSA